MTPTKERRPTTWGSQPSEELTNYTAIVTATVLEHNEFAEVANRFAARGHDLIRVDNDSPCRYFICTRGRSLMVTSWLAVKTLLVHIGRSA